MNPLPLSDERRRVWIQICDNIRADKLIALSSFGRGADFNSKITGVIHLLVKQAGEKLRK